MSNNLVALASTVTMVADHTLPHPDVNLTVWGTGVLNANGRRLL